MAQLQLPRTSGCIVCGHNNPIGLHLTSFVDEASGVVEATWTPGAAHIGFQGVIHGGVLSTVIDEAMVWAATWAGKRFCLAAELNVRFRKSAAVGRPLRVVARVELSRSKLILTSGELLDGDVRIIEATGKYIPLPADENAKFVATLVDEPAAAAAMDQLRRG